MHLWKDEAGHAAAFLAEADGALFARAAEQQFGWALMPVEEEAALPFPVYYERRQIVFEAGRFSTHEAQAFASALFARFSDGAAYPMARGDTYLAPLQMATAEFLSEFEDPEAPYDAVAAFVAEAAQERPLSEDYTELEEFLATTTYRVTRRAIPRWKDMIHLAIKRQEAADDYAMRKRTPASDEALEAFLAEYRARETVEPSDGRRSEEEIEDTSETSADSLPFNASARNMQTGSVAEEIGEASPRDVSRRDLRRTHKVLVDADACPVVRLIEKLCERYDVPVALFCDDHHIMASTYSEVIRVPKGKHAADYAIVGLCHKGDIVVTEDTGLAMLVLAKEAYPIAADGWRYTARLPWQAADPRAARRALHSRMHKRSEADDEAFERGFLALLRKKFFGEEEG